MNLYLISQDQNTGWDTYDSAVVCAHDEEEARSIHPSPYDKDFKSDTWCNSPAHVKVKWIGIAAVEYDEPGIICTSFNAG